MRAFVIRVRPFRGLLTIALLSAVACGGHAFESRSGAEGGGAGSAGGFPVTAGTGSGDAGGGAVGDAGSVGGAGAAGSGADGGSGAAGGTDVRACTSNWECEVVPQGCCSCGSGPVSNYAAINSMYETQYESHCNAVDCPPCGPVTFDLNDPVRYYVATCQQTAMSDLPSGGVAITGHCAVVDLRTTDLTACKLASDCSLRGGTGCCSDCGAGVPVAINGSKEFDLKTEVCGDAPPICGACMSTPDYDATCSAGRCSVEVAPPTTCSPQTPCTP